MKILITGAKGMLGQELASVFSGEELFLWDKEDLDITDELAVNAKILEIKPDLIINSAAYNNVDDCETNFDLAWKINAEGPRNLAMASALVGAKFVHYSTDYVFSGKKRDGYIESDQPEPISKYAESKLGGEKVLELADNVYLIRSSRLFGRPGQSEDAKRSFVDLMLKLGREKTSLDLVDAEVSSPTYAVDLARQTKLLVTGNYGPGIYHIVNKGTCTWYEFGLEIFRQAKIDVLVNDISSEKLPRQARRPAYSSLLNSRLPKMRTWQEALAEYLKSINEYRY